MFAQGEPAKVFVAMRPVDFRKGIDGLALAMQEMFGLDPASRILDAWSFDQPSRLAA